MNSPEGTPSPTQQERDCVECNEWRYEAELLRERIESAQRVLDELGAPKYGLKIRRSLTLAGRIRRFAATAAPAPLTREPTWLPFNINWRARVRLNDKGRRIWSAYWNETPTVQAQVDADGWLDQQAWHLMEVFGEHLHIGANSPFETEWQLYFERLPAAEEGARAPQRHMAFVASKQTAPPLTIYEAEGARAAAR